MNFLKKMRGDGGLSLVFMLFILTGTVGEWWVNHETNSRQDVEIGRLVKTDNDRKKLNDEAKVVLQELKQRTEAEIEAINKRLQSEEAANVAQRKEIRELHEEIKKDRPKS